MSWDKWEENTLCIEMLCIACWLDGVTCIRNSTEIDYVWVTSGNSYVLPSNHMLECVDTDDCFYLIIGTEVGYVRPHEKPPETEESLQHFLSTRSDSNNKSDSCNESIIWGTKWGFLLSLLPGVFLV